MTTFRFVEVLGLGIVAVLAYGTGLASGAHAVSR